MRVVGTFQDAGVIQSAYNLNNELRVMPVSAADELVRDSCSFVTVSSPAVVVETLKQVSQASSPSPSEYPAPYSMMLLVLCSKPYNV